MSESARHSTRSRDFMLFIVAVALFSFSQSIVNTVFNNFLKETFHITSMQRGILELPRELPGFLVVFVSVVLFFAGPRRMASLANILAAVGVFCLGLFSTGFAPMLGWLFILSIGQHLMLPLNQSLGMEFARDDNAGRRLGRQTGAMNFAAIAGSLMIFVGFTWLNFTFTVSFLIASVGFVAAAWLLGSMAPGKPEPMSKKLILRKEYGLFYWLSILFGTRKQIFLTFAPWVLVIIFNQKTEVVAILLFIGGIIGIGFNPVLGAAIDRLGERFVLMVEAALLIVVCLAYGFSRRLFPETVALYVTCACFIMDQILMWVSMARATYIKKIARHPGEVASTLAMGTSIDHVFSIGIALGSSVIWDRLGYEYVFLLGAAIAIVNLFSASRIVIPRRAAAVTHDEVLPSDD